MGRREVTEGNPIPIILLRLEIRVRQDDLQRGAMIKANTVDVDPRDVLPNHVFGEMKIPEVACLTMLTTTRQAYCTAAPSPQCERLTSRAAARQARTRQQPRWQPRSRSTSRSSDHYSTGVQRP